MTYMVPLLALTAFWEIPLTLESLFEAVECGAVFYIFAVLYTMISALKKKSAAEESVPAQTPAQSKE